MPAINRRDSRSIAVLLFQLMAIVPTTAQVLVANKPDPLTANLDIPTTAPRQGMWSPVKGWPIIGLHSALMPTGVVMTYGSPLGNGIQDGRTFDLWDPARGLDDPAAHFTLPNAQTVDSFCSAATLLTSGAMLISGGNSVASGRSSQASTLFDPSRDTPTAVAAQTAYRRWYASMITLADGRALIGGGGAPYATNAFNDVAGALSRGDISQTPEVYNPGSGWSQLTGAASRDAFGPDFNRWWYPRMWVAPNGRVFGLSAEKMWMLNPAGAGSIVTLGTFKTGFSTNATPNTGPTSTATMFDVGRILQVGGNGPANGYATPSSAAATVIDVTTGAPVLKELTPMSNPRQWANSTVLPDGKVVVTGGSRFADNAGTDAVYPAEIWNPATAAWTVGASAAVYRGYHSSAVLLPDATILSTGGGVPGPVNNFNAEIYYPPYLFTTQSGKAVLAPRPIVSSISATKASYGGTLSVSMWSDDVIAKVAVVGTSTTTHSFNSGQRYIPATFTQNGRSISISMPSSANIAPPGYYLVFLVNSAGVPSNGVIVSLNATQPPAAPMGAGQLWAKIGVASSRVAHGGDGVTIVVNTPNGTLWKYSGDNAWTQLQAPTPMADVAVVNLKSVYAIGASDRLVYRYNGAQWSVVGRSAATIGAAADGTVVVTSTDKSIWKKNNDNDVEAWTKVPGSSLRVAPQNAGKLWSIGADNNVYRGDAAGNWTAAGVDVIDIAVSPDGHVLVVNKQNNNLWADARGAYAWAYVPFAGKSIAVADGGEFIVVGMDGNVYRK
jgi:galactose oxidase